MMHEPGSLAEVFAQTGSSVQTEGAQALLLTGGQQVWLIEAGAVDLFLTRLVAGQACGALHPLSRGESGQLLWALPDERRHPDWGLVALGNGDCRLRQLSWPQLADWAVSAEQRMSLADARSAWCERLLTALEALPPAGACLATSGENAILADTPILGPQAAQWVELLDGDWHYLGAPAAPLPAGYYPFGRQAWLESRTPGRLRLIGEVSAVPAASLQASFEKLQDGLCALLVARTLQQEDSECQRLQSKLARENVLMSAAMHRLRGVLEPDSILPGTTSPAANPLLAACQRLGRELGIEFQPAPPNSQEGPCDHLAEIAEGNQLRLRRVALKGEWWLKPGLPLLAFRRDDRQPLSLIPGRQGYRMVSTDGRPEVAVDAEIAAKIDDFAWLFYRSFGDAALGVIEMLRFGSHGCLPDTLMVMAMGLATGLLGMLTPMATGLLFDTVIPGADRNQLLQLGLALLVGALAGSLFEIARGYAMLRAEGRMDMSIQSAVWDRLLRLPPAFFRAYPAGDLAVRANGINSIRQALSGQALQMLLAAVFSSFNLGLLFYYNLKLALLGMLLVALAMLTTAVCSGLRLRHERHLAAVEGRISGQVFQYLGGIAKLRVTGAESRAFFNWASNYGQQQEHLFRARMIGTALEVFNSSFPVVANLLIFAAIAFSLAQDQRFSTGDFLAFNAAFGGFLGAMLSATGALMGLLDIVPIYERARPILQTPPEITEAKAHPGQLTGDIEISHLSFSYSADGPSILQDLNLHIHAGEFVAIVGASGSGKSTLLRLLLGFEQPTLGSIYYDRQDLASLDPGSLRRQLGVVLQNGQLISGDIFSNIVGSSPLSLDDAWTAATQAGIADDIREMPMGMHTMVSDGGSTLSGGQRQRLMIARAIVRRPRIIYFDEATSALDNQAQAMVSASLEQLHATRIVIAHRLSTIIHADRILVMAAGKIVQAGTYAELIQAPGLFADLARRQII